MIRSGLSRWLGVLGICAGALGLLSHAVRAQARPASCKPMPPVSLELHVLRSDPGQPVQFEVRIEAQRPVEDLALDIRLPAAARRTSATPSIVSRLASGARQAVALGAALPPRGHAEIVAVLRFRYAGSVMTRAASLSFDDGQPSKPATGRLTTWNGAPVLEFPAMGVGR